MDNESLIPDDFDELLDQYKKLKKELNKTKQNLYESSRQLKVNEAVLAEYQSDIELLQGREESKNEKLKAKIASLEETITGLRTNQLENICSLENELEKRKKETDDLKRLLEKKNDAEATSNVSMNLNEIIDLTKENELLQEEVQQIKEAFERLRIQNSTLEETVEHCKEEIKELKDSLTLKREELAENATIIDKLNDQLLCSTRELENYKQKPLDADSKGNSLFAEVDDRRVHLQDSINHMKSNYIRLKQEHSQHVKLISQLRKENADLRETWKKDLEEIQEDKYWVNDTLKRHVERQKEIIEDQKKQLEHTTKPAKDQLNQEFKFYEFYEQTIKDKSNEIEKWKKKYSNTSINEHLLSRNLAEANKKLRLMRLELQQQAEEPKEIKIQKEHEGLCHKCKSNKEDDIGDESKAYGPPGRKPLKSCLKQERQEIPDNDETLHFNTSEDHTKKEDNFNIFGGEITHRKKVSTFHTTDLNNDTKENVKMKIELDDQENDLTSSQGQENGVFITDTSDKEKKGVAFTENTVDPVGNSVQRRNTRAILIKKIKN